VSTVTFADLGLSEPLLRALSAANYATPTPIQARSIPALLSGRDVLGVAQTGTGKTAAFALPVLQLLAEKNERPVSRSPRALVLAPTRELAVQIARGFDTYGRGLGLKLCTVVGGLAYGRQIETLARGVDILVATPGRLLDLVERGNVKLERVTFLVLDEADRMFDMGFIADVRFLLRRLPHPTQRLSMLFSATLSHRVLELSYEHMNNAEFVRIEPDKVTADNVRQSLYFPAANEKLPLLVGLLRKIDPHRTMVFVNTKRVAEDVVAMLNGNGYKSEVLSGDVPQNKRLRLLREFTGGELPVLVTTDVASRGLHIPDVSHVVNYDLPQDAEDYVHRIGRTARAGAFGDAISFACEEYSFSLPDIEKYIGHSIPREPLTGEMLPELAPPEHRERHRPIVHGGGGRRGGGGGGGRRSGGGGGGRGRSGGGGRGGRR
jgi:ATP-dependent RNA helicase RhlB